MAARKHLKAVAHNLELQRIGAMALEMHREQQERQAKIEAEISKPEASTAIKPAARHVIDCALADIFFAAKAIHHTSSNSNPRELHDVQWALIAIENMAKMISLKSDVIDAMLSGRDYGQFGSEWAEVDPVTALRRAEERERESEAA